MKGIFLNTKLPDLSKNSTYKSSKTTLKMMIPRIGFVSLGCPKALVDTEKIISALKLQGYQSVDNYKFADLVLINTCGFINTAIEESMSAIAEALAEIQDEGAVVVCGCMGNNPQRILDKFPQVKAVVGTDAKEVIDVVNKVRPLKIPKSFTDKLYLPLHGIKLTPAQYSYVKIAEGCNHKCKFCIIPQMRGKLISRSIKDIVSETQSLINNGCQEILLIAQDLLAYGMDFRAKNANPKKIPIIELIDELAKLPAWLRLHYIYPYPFVEEIIYRMADGKVLPYLDIPLQHVSARILRSMQRPASGVSNINSTKNHSKILLTRINNWRKAVPELTIRSTFIVGYPGEQESDFEELLSFIGEANLDRVGCFTYSQVEGAAANKLSEQISEELKFERQNRLMKLQEKISKAKLKKRIGKNYEVIIQNKVNIEGENYYLSRSFAEAPDIDGDVLIPEKSVLELQKKEELANGQHLEVKIVKSDTHDLIAKAIKVIPNEIIKVNSGNSTNSKLKAIPISTTF